MGFASTPPEKMDEYVEMTDKYTDGKDELAPAVKMQHPNRNTEKGEEIKGGYKTNQ